MRHQKTRHKLSRDASHRKALLANLCIEVIDHERIKTTQAKAKAVKPEIEQLITLAKRGDLHARGQVASYDGPPAAVRALNAILPRDIGVIACEQAPAGFSARHDALSRSYLYRVHTRRAGSSPFWMGRALWWPHRVDRGALEA